MGWSGQMNICKLPWFLQESSVACSLLCHSCICTFFKEFLTHNSRRVTIFKEWLTEYVVVVPFSAEYIICRHICTDTWMDILTPDWWTDRWTDGSAENGAGPTNSLKYSLTIVNRESEIKGRQGLLLLPPFIIGHAHFDSLGYKMCDPPFRGQRCKRFLGSRFSKKINHWLWKYDSYLEYKQRNISLTLKFVFELQLCIYANPQMVTNTSW